MNQQEVEGQEKVLENRFLKVKTVKGTRDFHAVIPISNDTIMFKHFSKSVNGTKVMYK